MQHAVFELDQGFRRGAGDFDVGAGKIKHVGRGVGGAQHPVGVEQAAFVGGGEAVADDRLEDVAFPDVGLRFFNHRAVFVFVEHRRELACKAAGRLFLFDAVLDEFGQVLHVHFGLAVAGFRIFQISVGDEDNFLGDVVEGDDFVEEHHVDVVEVFGIVLGGADRRLGVAEAFKGEVADQAAGEGRKGLELRAFVFGEHVS